MNYEEMLGDIINDLKSNYAMAFFKSLPNDDGKKLIMTLIKNGCPPRIILDSLIELQMEKNNEIKN